MQARHRARSGVRQSLQRYRRVSDRAGPVRGSHSLARTGHGSAPLRAAPLSALQPGPRLPWTRDVQPRDALLPGSAGDRAAVFAGAAGAGFAPPHGQLKKVISFQFTKIIPRFPISAEFTRAPPARMV